MTTYTERATEEFSRIAGEHVEVRNYGDEATIICSEMGMRRIADRLTHISKGYSQNLDAWYITIARGTPTLTPTTATPAYTKRVGEYDPTTRQYPAFVTIDGEPEQLVGHAWSAGAADRLADEFAYNYYADNHTPEKAAAIAVEMSEGETALTLPVDPATLKSYLHARSISELRVLAAAAGIYKSSMRRRVVLIEAIYQTRVSAPEVAAAIAVEMSEAELPDGSDVETVTPEAPVSPAPIVIGRMRWDERDQEFRIDPSIPAYECERCNKHRPLHRKGSTWLCKVCDPIEVLA